MWVRLSEIDVSLLPTFLSIFLEDSVSYYFIAGKAVTYEFFKWTKINMPVLSKSC